MTNFLIAFWRRLWCNPDDTVSGATVQHYARAEGRAGWDGPRWDLARGRKSFDEGWRQ